MQKSIGLSDGTVVTVNAMTQSVMTRVVRQLNAKKPSQRISGLETDLERNLEFKQALASAVLAGLTLGGNDQSIQARAEWLENYPGSADFVLKQARLLETEASAVFEVEEKNS